MHFIHGRQVRHPVRWTAHSRDPHRRRVPPAATQDTNHPIQRPLSPSPRPKRHSARLPWSHHLWCCLLPSSTPITDLGRTYRPNRLVPSLPVHSLTLPEQRKTIQVMDLPVQRYINKTAGRKANKKLLCNFNRTINNPWFCESCKTPWLNKTSEKAHLKSQSTGYELNTKAATAIFVITPRKVRKTSNVIYLAAAIAVISPRRNKIHT